MNKKSIIILLALLATAFSSGAWADNTINMSRGQTIYVPAYSHIYFGNKETPYLLTVTLSIRNIDPVNAISITRVNYYESQGKILKKYIIDPVDLAPLHQPDILFPSETRPGGSGANFLVKWTASKMVNPPIIESIMIGTQSQQGISFISRGEVISDID